MPAFLKVVVYFVVLILLAWASNSIPKSGEPFKGLVALCAVAWMVGGMFLAFRGVVRFMRH